MGKLDVRIVRLPPSRVAVAHGYGDHPEAQSWRALLAFAKSKGMCEDLECHRFFGFNNPAPSPGSAVHGYDQWMTVGTDVTPEDQVQVADFAGGLCAVLRCEGAGNLGTVWQQLSAWREKSEYSLADGQCMEEVLNPGAFDTTRGGPTPDDAWDKVQFDLHLPIQE